MIFMLCIVGFILVVWIVDVLYFSQDTSCNEHNELKLAKEHKHID
ncbi:hypothetical protein [Campylobacter anatolicus]|nr:hypothetical protein [Campylobacter anatolicus]